MTPAGRMASLRSGLPGGVFEPLAAILAIVVFGVGLVYATASAVGGSAVSVWAAPLAAALLLAELVLLLFVRGVRTMALQTLRQCIRARVTVTFVAVLVLGVGALAVFMEGDGTLTGKLRSLLMWGTALTGVLAGLLVIFLSCAVITHDVRDRQVLLTVTKPLPRWQYVLGRWVGVVAVGGAVIVVVMGAQFAIVQYFRMQPALHLADFQSVETEVFVAREEVHPPQAPLDERVAVRLRQMQQEGTYAAAIEQYLPRAKGNPEAARAELIDEVRRQEQARLQSRGPGGLFEWRFSGIRPRRTRIAAVGRIVRAAPSDGVYEVSADRALVSRILVGGPIEFAGVDARVDEMGQSTFYVVLRPDDRARRHIAALRKGDPVDLAVYPTIQVRYKAMNMSELEDPEKRFFSEWRIENPQTGEIQLAPRADTARTPTTFTASARAVSADGRTVISCRSHTNASVRIKDEDVSILYDVGSFEANYARAVALMIVQVMFLAAVGTMWGTLVSFPVAVFACFGLVPFLWWQDFLGEAAKLPGSESAGMALDNIFLWIGHWLLRTLYLLIPDAGASAPAEWLVDGRYISWVHLSSTAVFTVAIHTLAALGVGCLIFSRRQLAGAER